MDLTLIFGLLVIVLIILAPAYFFKIKNRLEEKQSLSVLRSFAKEYNCVLSTYDFWYKTIIGIDNKEIKSLFFIRETPDNEFRMAICLDEIQDCRILKTEKKINYNHSLVIVVEKIELRIINYNVKPDIILEFYNNDYQPTLSEELQLAQKWKEIIKSNINSMEKQTKLINDNVQDNSEISEPKIKTTHYISDKRKKIEQLH